MIHHWRKDKGPNQAKVFFPRRKTLPGVLVCRFLILVLSIVLKSVFVHMLDHFKATAEYNTPCIPELFCLAQDRIDCISMQ